MADRIMKINYGGARIECWSKSSICLCGIIKLKKDITTLDELKRLQSFCTRLRLWLKNRYKLVCVDYPNAEYNIGIKMINWEAWEKINPVVDRQEFKALTDTYKTQVDDIQKYINNLLKEYDYVYAPSE